jgi:hypothetical protein
MSFMQQGQRYISSTKELLFKSEKAIGNFGQTREACKIEITAAAESSPTWRKAFDGCMTTASLHFPV